MEEEIQRLKARTMRVSIAEGTAANVSITFGDNFVIPFALALQIPPSGISILSGLNGIIGPLAQLTGSRLMEKVPRKSILMGGVAFQTFMWMIFVLIGAWFQKSPFLGIISPILIISAVLYTAFGASVAPSWVSVMGDIVPADRRGRYFSLRNILCNIIGFIALYTMASYLDLFRDKGKIFVGFFIIFGIAIGFRILSIYFLSQYYYPPLQLVPKDRLSFKEFVQELPKSPYGRITLFAALIYFTNNICSPLVSVYMLEELHYTYSTFMLVNLSAGIAGLIAFPFIGILCDKFGNLKIILISSIFIPISAVFWMIYTNPIMLIFTSQIIGGIAWNAFGLGTSNYLFDTIQSSRRGYYSAFYNLFIGMGLLLGGFLGSILFNTIPESNWILYDNLYHIIFWISTIGRAIVIIIFFPILYPRKKNSKFV